MFQKLHRVSAVGFSVGILVGFFAGLAPVAAVPWIGGFSGDNWNDAANWDNAAGPFVPDGFNGESADIGPGDNPQIIEDAPVPPRFILIDGGTVDHTAGLMDLGQVGAGGGGPELGNGNAGESIYNLSGGELRLAAAQFSDVNIGLAAGSGLSTFNISGTGFLNQTGVFDPGRGVQVGRFEEGLLQMSDSARLDTVGTLRNGGDSINGPGTIRIIGDGVQIDADDFYSQDEASTLDLIFSATNTISPINTLLDARLDGNLRAEFQTSPSLGQQFTIINTGTGAAGTFAGLFPVGLDPGLGLGVTNNGGDGNDVVLQIISDTGVNEWLPDAAGDWNELLNWSGGIPDGRVALFGGNISAPRTVFTDAAVNVSGLSFNSANTYAVAGTGSVTLTGDGANATIDITSGDHQMQVAVNLGSDTDVNGTGGSLTISSTLDLDGNALNIQSGTININGQVLPGAGGMVNSSATLGTAGATAFGGDLVTSGTLAVQIAGTGSDQFSQFNVGGSADLSGLIDVSFIDGFSLGGGESFEILTAGTLVDNGIQLAAGGANDSFTLVVTPGANGSLLLSSAGLPGDFNLDLVVDGTDFLLWQRNGLSASDLADWEANYGTDLNPAAASSTAVPEPASLLLMLAGLAAVGLKRSRELV
ncbi:PEP-CTERM sorting domain-containing protein [Pirellulales bacterium]|nr:PEP-CTERM sorting domain-containing protein [Pirellulales bacterium]